MSGVIIGRGGKAIHIEGPGGGGDATLCGMGADYIKGTDAAVSCKKCLAKQAKLAVLACRGCGETSFSEPCACKRAEATPELHPSQVREVTVYPFETIDTRVQDGVLVQVQVAYGDDGAPLATRYVPVEQAPETSEATIMTGRDRDRELFALAEELDASAQLLAQLAAHQGVKTPDGGYTILSADQMELIRGVFWRSLECHVRSYERSCACGAVVTLDGACLATGVPVAQPLELAAPSRPYSGRGKCKGSKWSRRRSNSRMRVR